MAESKLSKALNALTEALANKDFEPIPRQVDAVLRLCDNRERCINLAIAFRSSCPAEASLSADHIVASARIFEAYLDGQDEAPTNSSTGRVG